MEVISAISNPHVKDLRALYTKKGRDEQGLYVLEGVNIVSKCVRARRANERGGIVQQPAAFDASNAMVICPVCHEATRLGHQVVDGKKVRVCKACGASVEEGRAKSTAKKAAKKAKKKADEE